MSELKLMALDPEDLSVVSAHLQDSVLRIADVAYLPAERRFAMIVNRFDWTQSDSGSEPFVRVRSALRFEKVNSAQFAGFAPSDDKRVLSLLALTFEPSDPPSGHITLVFSGDAAVRLAVECIEAEVRDLGAKWSTKTKPHHSVEDTPTGDGSS